MRTREKCRKHQPQASVFLHFYLKYRVYVRKTIKHAFSVLYSDKTWIFDQSERTLGPIYILIRDKFSIHDLRQELFHLALFHSTKMLFTMENLYLFFSLKHKHLVTCITIQGICIKAFWGLPIADCHDYDTNEDTSPVAFLACAPTCCHSSGWQGFLLAHSRQHCRLRPKFLYCLKIVQKICVPFTIV